MLVACQCRTLCEGKRIRRGCTGVLLPEQVNSSTKCGLLEFHVCVRMQERQVIFALCVHMYMRCIDVCVYVCVRMCVRVCAPLCVCVCAYVFVCTYEGICVHECVCVCICVCTCACGVCVCAGEDDLEVLLTTSVFGINVVCFRRAGVDSLEEVDFCAIHRCRQKESWSVLKEARLFLFDFEYQQS